MAAFLMTPVKWLRPRERENREGQMQEETEELIKLIHLVGREGRERQAERMSHSVIFPNTMNHIG